MPISVQCSCGKEVAAPSKLAGKRVKCPGCGQPLAIPAASGKQAATNSSGKISVKCSCGQSFAAPAKLAGKTVKCPGCQNPVTIPGGKVTPSATAGSDKIKTKCQCGQVFAAPAKLAGKAVKCPACKQPVRVPAPAAAATKAAGGGPDLGGDDFGDAGIGSLLDEVGFQRAAAANRCPECRTDLTEDAILCVNCGYNLETGKTLKTKFEGRREEKVTSSMAPDGLEGMGGQPAVPAPLKSAINWLNLQGFLGLLGVIALLFLMFASAWVELPAGDEGAAALLNIVRGALAFYITLIALITALFFIASNLLKKGSKGGWYLAFVLSILQLPNFPLGTIFGVLVIVGLFNEESKAYCS